MTITDWQQHVEEAIARSLRHQAFHDAGVIGISGFSTRVIRCLFSNLVHLPKPDPVYVEFGLYAGGAICSTMSNSPNLTVFGVEDFSQPFGKDGVFDELRRNLETYTPQCREAHIINENAFTMDIGKIHHKADVISYDAVHDEWAQRDAWSKLIEPIVGETACVVIDDFSWQCVRDGTRDGIKDVERKLRVAHQWELKGRHHDDAQTWWNGVFIAVVERV